jgi:hypothetical protein
VIAHQSAGFDLGGEMPAGALDAVAESAAGGHRVEQVDHQRGEIDVHLVARMLESCR